MIVTGKAFKYGDNVDTDVIIPARYLNSSDPEHLKQHCMEDIDAGFVSEVSAGDIMVAGKNFGCGSSREHAPVAIKASGISLVIAESFARILPKLTLNPANGKATSSSARQRKGYSQILTKRLIS